MESLLNKKNVGYTIIKECHLSNLTAFVIGYHETRNTYVVWRAKSEDEKTLYGFSGGYYTDNSNKANIEFYHRISNNAEHYKEYYIHRRTYEVQNAT